MAHEEPEIDKELVKEIEKAIAKTNLRQSAAMAISSFARREPEFSEQIAYINRVVARCYLNGGDSEDEESALRNLHQNLRMWLSLYKAQFDATADYE